MTENESVKKAGTVNLPQILCHILFVAILVLVDQITKYWVRNQFMDGGDIPLIPGVFRIVFHKNDGAVWGLLSGKNNAVIFLSIMTVIILFVIIFLYIRIPKTRHYFPLVIISLFVISGAIGNFIDRTLFGYVTDFLYIELINFPVFNIADCYITISIFIIFILMLTYYRNDEMEFLSLKKKSQAGEQDGEK